MTLYPQRTLESQETTTSIDISGINQNILDTVGNTQGITDISGIKQNILDTVGNTQGIIERLGIDGGNGIISHLKPEEARNILGSADIQ